MTRARQHPNRILGLSRRATTVALVLTIVLVLTVVATQSAQAQTYNVIHNFTGGPDGANPYAGLTMDKAGNLYGTTLLGGTAAWCIRTSGCGTVFKLTHKGSGWVLNPLYSFDGGNDGAVPAGDTDHRDRRQSLRRPPSAGGPGVVH